MKHYHKEIIVNLPLYVMLPRGKRLPIKYNLNLNIYRNTHFQRLNQAKKIYTNNLIWRSKEEDWFAEYDLPFKYLVSLEYTLFKETNRITDLSNVLSVIDKFTQDALKKMGVIKDDSTEYINRVTYIYGCVDRDNPRCELKIK